MTASRGSRTNSSSTPAPRPAPRSGRSQGAAQRASRPAQNAAGGSPAGKSVEASSTADQASTGPVSPGQEPNGQSPSAARYPVLSDGIGTFTGRIIVEESAVEPFHGGASEAVETTVVDDEPLPEDRFSNRELSWLDFNARVLALAEDPEHRLLERAKFLAIFASNLDEFYMVRVAGLKRRRDMGLSVTSADGLTASEQLALISARTQELVDRQGRCFTDMVLPAMAEAGIRIVHWQSIDPEDRERLAD